MQNKERGVIKMPNWCEGKLKIRGKKEHLVKFFHEGTSLLSYKRI